MSDKHDDEHVPAPIERRAQAHAAAVARFDEARAKRKQRRSGKKAPPEPPPGLSTPEGQTIVPATRLPYRHLGDGYARPVGDNGDWAPLTNFRARIEAEIVHDDGFSETRSYRISGTQGEQVLAPLDVPVERFASLNWVADWGARAVVYAGLSTREHARVAIQTLSPLPSIRHVYTHTGWRRLAGRWTYLHAGGGLDAEGAVEGVEIDLAQQLGDYRLMESDDVAGALRQSLRLLDALPPQLAWPCLLAPFRAVLAEVAPIDFSLFLTGETGVRKSQIAGVIQAFFGPAWHGQHLPGSWDSTANSLQLLASAAKDAVLVVDDFAPRGSSAEQARLHHKADQLLRAAGNRSGRARLTSDIKLRPVYVPRGLIVSTGEEVPVGQSLRGRLLLLEFERGDVDLDRLTELQASAATGALAGVTAAWCRWLAPRLDALRESLPARIRELRSTIAVQAHARTPDILASLYAGAKLLAAFAAEHGIEIDPDAGLEALIAAGNAQTQHQRDDDPVRRFIELIVTALASGRAHLARADKPDAEVADPALGWRRRIIGVGDYERVEWQPQGERIGWFDADGVYLAPGTAYAVAQRLARDQGTSLVLTEKTLLRRLRDRGLLAACDQGRTTCKKTIGDTRTRIVHLHREYVIKSGASGAGGAGYKKFNDLGADFAPRLPIEPGRAAGQAGQTAGQNPRYQDRPVDSDCPAFTMECPADESKRGATSAANPLMEKGCAPIAPRAPENSGYPRPEHAVSDTCGAKGADRSGDWVDLDELEQEDDPWSQMS